MHDAHDAHDMLDNAHTAARNAADLDDASHNVTRVLDDAIRSTLRDSIEVDALPDVLDALDDAQDVLHAVDATRDACDMLRDVSHVLRTLDPKACDDYLETRDFSRTYAHTLRAVYAAHVAAFNTAQALDDARDALRALLCVSRDAVRAVCARESYDCDAHDDDDDDAFITRVGAAAVPHYCDDAQHTTTRDDAVVGTCAACVDALQQSTRTLSRSTTR